MIILNGITTWAIMIREYEQNSIQSFANQDLKNYIRHGKKS